MIIFVHFGGLNNIENPKAIPITTTNIHYGIVSGFISAIYGTKIVQNLAPVAQIPKLNATIGIGNR